MKKPRKVKKVVVEADEIDEYDEAAVKAMVARTPEVRFRHASYFTDDEDRIIAASIKSRVQLYKVAASLKCSYPTLKKHIENTPVLAEIVKESREIECGELREAVNDLIKMRHPQVVMWRAKQLMPNEYGDAVETEEDDSRIIIGAIPEDMLEEADRALALAAEKPPEVGLAAMMDPRTKEQVEKKVAEAKKESEQAVAEKTKPVNEDEDEGEEIDEGGDEFFGDGDFGSFDGGGDLGF